jgi:hypothetical protein
MDAYGGYAERVNGSPRESSRVRNPGRNLVWAALCRSIPTLGQSFLVGDRSRKSIDSQFSADIAQVAIGCQYGTI